MTKKTPLKIQEWNRFSRMVGTHIEKYAIEQYGDYPDPMIEEFSVQSIKEQLLKYVSRINKGARGSTEEIRDCLKIAHYACLLRKKYFESYIDDPKIDLKALEESIIDALEEEVL